MLENRLEQIIMKKIEREGPVTFETFMEMALYHPQGGYYMSDAVRIGPGGDFYTGPHLHPIFGWLLAVQLDEMKRIIGDPERFAIVEVGAGKGFLAEGIISYVMDELSWKHGWRYVIVEKNPSAVEVQKRILGRYGDLLEWKSSLDQVDRFCGCVVSNELLDAFPVHLLRMNEQAVPREIYVGSNDKAFKEIDGDLSTSDLEAYIKRYRLPKISGYRTEANLRVENFLANLNHILAEGFIITIDYGYCAHEYYSPQRRKGTLLAYSNHRVNENPLANVGNQDITAHINFTALSDWGEKSGLKTIGYCSQGAFLASLGIDRLVARELERDKTFQSELLKIKGLLFGMGDSHQVMLQYKGRKGLESLRGLSLSNRINRL
ncbi:MAG: SAM-dependent methyltransferase [Desulfobacteraceae bacterium]|nr:MAG: SAM-dependent methyltransferase [Desulfobacteraceae bacterium]